MCECDAEGMQTESGSGCTAIEQVSDYRKSQSKGVGRVYSKLMCAAGDRVEYDISFFSGLFSDEICDSFLTVSKIHLLSRSFVIVRR